MLRFSLLLSFLCGGHKYCVLPHHPEMKLFSSALLDSIFHKIGIKWSRGEARIFPKSLNYGGIQSKKVLTFVDFSESNPRVG